jgi:acyl carrier protein phosphodiesterase
MNFLAHIYLSGNDEEVILGNFIADGIKGKAYENFPKGIQTGILLHREIDTFTDAHPIVRQSTKRLHKNFGHFSGVIVDVFYDHFLAKNWKTYSNEPLDEYVQKFYRLLQQNQDRLPKRIKNMMPYMLADNWLLSYAEVKGISKILFQMSHRIKYKIQLNEAITELEENYTAFENEFTTFFEELSTFCSLKLKEISSELK